MNDDLDQLFRKAKAASLQGQQPGAEELPYGFAGRVAAQVRAGRQVDTYGRMVRKVSLAGTACAFMATIAVTLMYGGKTPIDGEAAGPWMDMPMVEGRAQKW